MLFPLPFFSLLFVLCPTSIITSGGLYSWGANSDYVLGLGSGVTDPKVTVPTKAEAVEGRVIQVRSDIKGCCITI